MAQTQNLGTVSVVASGTWNSYTTYPPLCIVRSTDGAYMSYNRNTNIQPGVTVGWESYWFLLCQDAMWENLTEANQTAIVNAVLAALPNGDEVSY